MKKIIFLMLMLVSISGQSQIVGLVTDQEGKPLPFVNVYVENTYNATSTNEQGKYELSVHTPGSYTIAFQYLGFKTKKIKTQAREFPHTVDAGLQEESFEIKEVTVNTKDNPADRVIQNTIAAREENTDKTGKFTADFYSRGIFRITNAPVKILGQRIDMFDDYLDENRSGILYLSETVSKLTYQKPYDLKETIVASKVSGNDNGYSFNNAASANFDFYQNNVALGMNTISPIASNAFGYYRYKLEGSFFDDRNQLIHKIKVTPRRTSEPVYDGFLYVVDGDWALYGIDLTIQGKQIQMPALSFLKLTQQYAYNSDTKVWAKNNQVLDFKAEILGLKFDGRFTYVYSGYVFEPMIDKKTFTAEVLKFEQGANKKTTDYWNELRPVPLTDEERADYIKKDDLQRKKESKEYLDSLDAKKNKFKWHNPVTGYNWRDSYRNTSINYDGILLGLGFNTVQGYNTSTGISFTKSNKEKRTYTTVGTTVNYGFAEDRFRAMGYVTRKFNNTSGRMMTVSGGNTINQFNPEKPISRIVNTIATSFFKRNYMKLYDRTFAAIDYREELFNGFHLTAGLEYNRRKQLFNNSEKSILRNKDGYTSNNPLAPLDFTTPFFETHELMKASVMFQINFGQQYWTRPDGKFNIPNDNFPTLYLGYEQGFAGTESFYEYQHAKARMTYNIELGNKGLVGMNIKAGKFFNADDIAFMDYKHFNGNLTHVGQSDRYLNVFNLLPYYAASTNDSYTESHLEYEDNGFIMNKIPLLKKLESTLVLGVHHLAIPDRKPYMEFSAGLNNLGIGKAKFLRFDYVRSYQNGFVTDGVVFGLKFLNILD